MKTLNKYLIPDLSSIILDYYYDIPVSGCNSIAITKNMKNLNKEYRNTITYIDNGNQVIGVFGSDYAKLYNYRYLNKYGYSYIYNINAEHVSKLSINYK